MKTREQAMRKIKAINKELSEPGQSNVNWNWLHGQKHGIKWVFDIKE